MSGISGAMRIAKQIAAKRGAQESRMIISCTVQQEDGIIYLTRRIAVRRTQRDIVKAQFRKHFASMEVEVLKDEFSFVLSRSNR
jgi:hypothetical protein